MNKNAFIFPGQGAQTPKMGQDFYESYDEARLVYEAADEILQSNLKKIIFGSDAAELTKTENSQPAIFVTSIAILRVVQKEFPELLPSMCGGLSLGEYSALVAAEKTSFEETLKLVAARGKFMQEASEKNPGAMAAVLGLEEADVRKAGYYVANLNCPGQVVIAGKVDEIDEACVKLKEAGAKRVIKLPVSGAFHSSLMNEARDQMKPLIEKTSINESKIGLVMNVTGSFVTEKAEIKENLVKQVSAMTKWLDCVKTMEEKGATSYISMGPVQLEGMNKKIGVKGNTISVQQLKDLEKVHETFGG